MDWKSLLERYMRAVIEDDHIVGTRAIDEVGGSDAEKAALLEMLNRIQAASDGAA